MTSIHTEALKPRCALRVGVIGNRRFDRETDKHPTHAAQRMKDHGITALEAIWDVVLESIETVLPTPITGPDVPSGLSLRDLFSPEEPRLAVLTSLAAGADQIGTFAVLHAKKAHPAVKVEIEAILPFDEDYYPGPLGKPRKEFRQAEADGLRELAGQATQVIRLPGEANDGQNRDEAYRQAAVLLLQNSDILLALYDPNRHAPDDKRSERPRVAGTAETIRLAVELEVPIVAVLTSEEEARIQVVHRRPTGGETAPQWSDAATVAEPQWRDDLRRCVREQLLLPEMMTPHADSHDDGETVKHATYRLGLIDGSERPPWLCGMWPARVILGAVWKLLQVIARAAANPALAPRSRSNSEVPHHPVTVSSYAPFYKRASDLAIDYMRTYRGAFVLSYWLAAAAVSAAVVLMATVVWAEGEPPSVYILMPLCVAKVGILTLLLWLALKGHRERYQEAGADFRYLTELLRPMQWLAPLGTYPPAVDLPLHAAPNDPRRKWMAWLVRAAARSSPSVPMADGSREIALSANDAALALERAAGEWLEEQILYHRQAAGRMHILEDGLERLTYTLIWIVFGAAVVACAIEFSQLESLRIASVTQGALAALLPAWIAAFAGIAFQSEAKRIAGTSDAMQAALQLQQRDLRDAADRIRSGKISGSDAVHTANALLRKSSNMTIGEAGYWKVLYQAHAIHAG